MAESETRYRIAERRVWESVGVTPTERSVRLRSGVSVRVQEVGEGPPVLFVHGASNGGTSWSSLIAGLPGFRCIALDRPGCCLSDPLPKGVGPGDVEAVERYADSLIPDVLDGLGLASANVVATSYGGYFAFRAVAAHPERIDRLVEFSWLMGAPMAKVPFMMRIGTVPGVGNLMARVPPTRGAVRMMLRQIGLRAALENGTFTDDMLDWFLVMLRDTDTMRNEFRSSPRVITPIRGLNQRMLLSDSLLGSIRMPVHFIWGGDDPNGGEAVARPFAAKIPNATLDMLPAAGHAPWIDEPQTTAAMTRAFLAG